MWKGFECYINFISEKKKKKCLLCLILFFRGIFLLPKEAVKGKKVGLSLYLGISLSLATSTYRFLETSFNILTLF